MSTAELITNKTVPHETLEKLRRIVGDDSPPLFCVVSDLNLSAKYGESTLFVFKNRIASFDNFLPGGVIMLDFDLIEEAKVKRLYGNAVFYITKKSGETIEILRSTYSVAELCESLASFINKLNDGGELDEQIEIVSSTYENRRSFCEKCGRKLAKPSDECLNCQGKSKMISTFSKYIKPHSKVLIVSLILSLITTSMALVPPYITKLMVDDVMPSRDSRKLLIIIFALLGAYIIQYLIGGIRAYLLRLAGDRIIIDLKKDIYAKAQYLQLKFYDKTSTGSVINRVNSDTSVLQQFMLRITQEAVVQLFMLVGIVVIMFSMDWQLTLLSLIPVPLVVLVSRFFGKKIGPLYRRLWRRSSAISSILADTIPGVRVVKTFSSEKRAIDKFALHAEDWMNEDKKAAKPTTALPYFITFLVTCGSLLIWFVGGRWVIDSDASATGRITIGLLVSFISYASMFYNPVNFFASLNDLYQNALASAEKVLDIINAEPEADFGKDVKPRHIDGRIEFRNVNFSFDRSKKVIDDASFVIDPGDVVGIVGTTGSGKSTLINLLMRFYDGYEGEILVDNIDINKIDLNYYRMQIGYVQQEPLMFRDTIYNNIAYSNPGAHPEQVIGAAEIANAHGFISKLPDSYDTMLGERGTGLSGGEKQRVSIARAVLKNPSILVFDEATSAVDSETEKLIQGAIDRMIRGRTTLMIAHRLSTLSKANKIIVVDKGKIIEFGTPQELLALEGKYYKLIQIQSMSEKVMAQKEAENFE